MRRRRDFINCKIRRAYDQLDVTVEVANISIKSPDKVLRKQGDRKWKSASIFSTESPLFHILNPVALLSLPTRESNYLHLSLPPPSLFRSLCRFQSAIALFFTKLNKQSLVKSPLLYLTTIILNVRKYNLSFLKANMPRYKCTFLLQFTPYRRRAASLFINLHIMSATNKKHKWNKNKTKHKRNSGEQNEELFENKPQTI